MHLEYFVLINIGLCIQHVISLYFLIKAFDLKYKLRTICLVFIFFVAIPSTTLYLYSIYNPFGARGVIIAAIVFLFGIFISKNKALDICVIMAAYFLLMIIADSLGTITLYLFLGSFTMNEKYLAIGSFLHSAYFAPLTIIFLKYYKKESIITKMKQLKIFLPFLLMQIIFLFLVYFHIQNDNKDTLMYYILAMLLVFVCMDILFFINLKQMIRKEVLEYRYGQLEMQRNFEYEYIMDQVEQSKKYKKFNHDLRNNLAILKGMLENNKDAAGLNMLNDMVSEGMKLEGMNFSTNPAVDALFNFKRKYADDKGIGLTANLGIPTELPIKDMELCSIFSNLLDNALEACINISVDKKWIKCYAGIDKGILIIKIENSNGVIQKSEKVKIKKAIDDSGLGLSIIEDIIRKYDGRMEIENNISEYKVYIFIPLNGIQGIK